LKQPPIANFQEDMEARVCRRRSGRRGYFVALPAVAAIVAVALLGMVGSRLSSAGNAHPSGSPEAALISASPTGPALRPPPPGPTPGPVLRLSNIWVDQNQTIEYDLPMDALPLDADGRNFLYTSGRDLFVLAPKQNTFHVATAPVCGQIEQAAISGNEVIYSEMVPAGYAGDGSEGCPNFGDAVDWRVSIVDFAGGTSHEVAKGTSAVPPGAGPAGAVPSVAITEFTYSFSRPDWSGKAASVEVRTLAGDELVPQSDPLLTPVQVHLGNSRLSVVSPGFSADQNQPSSYTLMATRNWSVPLQSIGLSGSRPASSL
jgi:hypothetical protein